MLVLAAMYLLALISYNPSDLPAWAHFSTAGQSPGVTHNFIGTLGAILAGYSLALAGWAVYLLPISVTSPLA